MKAISNKWYGCIRDAHDTRDRLFLPPPVKLADYPRRLDWRPHLPPCYNQGAAGTCGPNTMAGAVQFLQGQQGKPLVMPSRLFVYWNTEGIEGTQGTDSGVQIRDLIKATNKFGVCPETEWPYDIAQIPTAPPSQCFSDATQQLLLDYQRVDNTSMGAMVAALNVGPVLGGFTVYDSFESDAVASTGVVPMPSGGEDVQGGHAVLTCGYDLDLGVYIVRNSWDTDWGQDGYFTVPRAYWESRKLASDYWLCRKIT